MATMTRTRRNSFARRSLQLAIVLAAASTTSIAGPLQSTSRSLDVCAALGQMTVVAPRLPRRAVLIVDLGSMTVTAARQQLVADLGAMTVTAPREQVVAQTEPPLHAAF
jgi:hypothetical protein